jgi:PKD repeat protein
MKNKIILTVLILSMIALIFSGCGGIITPETPSDSLSAVITASPTSGEVPLKVTFDASESSAAQSNEIMSYEWDFGDDKTGEGQTVQHDFGSPGNYTVTLIIINNKGAVDTSSVIITVFQPTETVIEQNFNTQNGTEFDTGTGLKVSVPPSLNAEEVKLIVKYYSDPPQINDCIGNLFSAYSFNMIYEKESQRQKLRPLRGSFEPIKLTFDIPEEEDVRGALIVNKTDEGWVIAENKEGPYGGTIFEDGKKISISLEYSSDYALSTPAVLTYNQQDMQELLSELEAQNAVIESAPSVIPNYKGIIIIPKEDFPEGKGTAIPIHIPFYKYSSNANMEEESWNKKWEKTIRVIKKNYWALLATFDPGGLPLTPVGAAASFLVALEEASGNINEIYDITITIQENKNTGGNLRAIIQLGDPESAQWQRRIAGKAEMKGGPFVDGAWTDIWYRMIQDFCKEIGLPCKYSYYLLLESDLRHKEDEYVGYLSINEDNSFVEIPKIYSEDCIKIGHFELLFKRVIDIEFPILNSYILGKDFETAILEELSPIQIGLESAQSNLVPIANAGPDQTVQIGTLVTIDGSASYDNDGDTLSYNWTQIKGPEIVNLSDSNISKPTFTLTEVGVYEFELIVNDGKDDSEPDNVIINVMGSSCTAPGLFTLNAIPECNGTTSQIRLNWTNSSGASSYDVYRNNHILTT